MDHKIQLLHPAGKKAIRIDREKYDVLKKSLMNSLVKKGELTFGEIFGYVAKDFIKNKIKFEGCLAWYLEWVKLDLEAKKEITQIGNKPRVKYTVSRKHNGHAPFDKLS